MSGTRIQIPHDGTAISELQERPVNLQIDCVNGETFHESCFKSYGTLEKVKTLLRLNTPPEVVLEIIEEIYRLNPGRRILSDYQKKKENS